MIDISKIKKSSHLTFGKKSGLRVYPWKNCELKKILLTNLPLSESKIAILSFAGCLWN